MSSTYEGIKIVKKARRNEVIVQEGKKDKRLKGIQERMKAIRTFLKSNNESDFVLSLSMALNLLCNPMKPIIPKDRMSVLSFSIMCLMP